MSIALAVNRDWSNTSTLLWFSSPNSWLIALNSPIESLAPPSSSSHYQCKAVKDKWFSYICLFFAHLELTADYSGFKLIRIERQWQFDVEFSGTSKKNYRWSLFHVLKLMAWSDMWHTKKSNTFAFSVQFRAKNRLFQKLSALQKKSVQINHSTAIFRCNYIQCSMKTIEQNKITVHSKCANI